MEQVPVLAGLRRLIDILVEGYATLNRRLWILTIPIGLDLFLWLGPRITPRALAQILVSGYQNIALWGPSYMEPMEPGWIEQGTALIQDWGSQTNLAHLLSSFVVPLLIPKLSSPALPGYTAPVWAPALGWILLPIPLGAVALGLLLWCLYMAPIADLVRESGESGRATLQRVGRTWQRLLGLAGIVLLGGILFLLLSGLLTTVASLLSPSLGVLLSYLGIMWVLWLLIQFYLAPEAALFSGVGPLRALQYSLQVARTSPWQNLGFILLFLLIGNGTALLWQQLAGHPLGVLIGILGNAYIAAGLATARLIFYRERLQAWLAKILQAQQADGGQRKQ